VTDELTPDQEAEITRLLAEARHDEALPADVAARLDGVLNDLARPALVPAAVTDLAAHRHRRRNAGRLLLAAAAVVVGGVAVGQVLGDSGLSGDDHATSADAGAESQEVPRTPNDYSEKGGDTGTDGIDEGGGVGASSGATDPTASQQELDDALTLLDRLHAPLDLTSANFEVDVQRALRAQAMERRDAAREDLDGLAYYSEDFVCPDADYGPGAKLPAYYDAEEAVLVLRRPRAGVQQVDLLACGTAAELDSVELPAR
jgi:hypothetical protein